MLVLTRKIGEKLIIGNEIEVQILSISGDQVKIGIKAPASISIHRHEVYEAIQAANVAAAGAKTPDAQMLKRLNRRIIKKEEQ